MTIVATGILVNSALEAAEKLAAEGVSAEVINIHTIKPLDTELIVKSAKKTGKVVTAEEHSVIGGLGSAVCEALSELCPTPVCRIGINGCVRGIRFRGGAAGKIWSGRRSVYRRVKEFATR